MAASEGAAPTTSPSTNEPAMLTASVPQCVRSSRWWPTQKRRVAPTAAPTATSSGVTRCPPRPRTPRAPAPRTAGPASVTASRQAARVPRRYVAASTGAAVGKQRTSLLGVRRQRGVAAQHAGPQSGRERRPVADAAERRQQRQGQRPGDVDREGGPRETGRRRARGRPATSAACRRTRRRLPPRAAAGAGAGRVTTRSVAGSPRRRGAASAAGTAPWVWRTNSPNIQVWKATCSGVRARVSSRSWRQNASARSSSSMNRWKSSPLVRGTVMVRSSSSSPLSSAVARRSSRKPAPEGGVEVGEELRQGRGERVALLVTERQQPQLAAQLAQVHAGCTSSPGRGSPTSITSTGSSTTGGSSRCTLGRCR